MLSLAPLPFAVCTTLLMRVLSALESNRGLLPASAATLAVSLPLNYALAKLDGVAGLALAAALTQVLLCLVLAWLVFRRGGRLAQLEPVHG